MTSFVTTITNIDQAIVAKIQDIITSNKENLSSVVNIIKAGMIAVEKVGGLQGIQKTDYLVAVLTSISNTDLLGSDVSVALQTMIANGIVNDTATLVVDASKGAFSFATAVTVAEDVVKVVQDAVPIFGLFSCCAAFGVKSTRK